MDFVHGILVILVGVMMIIIRHYRQELVRVRAERNLFQVSDAFYTYLHLHGTMPTDVSALQRLIPWSVGYNQGIRNPYTGALQPILDIRETVHMRLSSLHGRTVVMFRPYEWRIVCEVYGREGRRMCRLICECNPQMRKRLKSA